MGKDRESMNKIDIVLTWVDQNDSDWRAEKDKYDPKKNTLESGESRYRDWDQLKYVFRGIDKFMPWVNRVYFVTWGHLPSWLNTSAPKLRIVNHKDYIPEEYLPTFNSNVLDLNMFRIKGLEEQYILFNDDTFVIKPTEAEDFFKDSKPCDMACISPQPVVRDPIMNVELNNLEIINDYFTVEDIKKNKKKWLDFKKYGSFALRTFLFMRFKTIIGLYVPHIPISHLKSVVEHLWEIEYVEYDSTCRRKFRTKLDINDWLSRSWQLMSGNFEPRSKDFGILVHASDVEGVKQVLWNSKYKMVCINDDATVTKDIFAEVKKEVNAELEKLLPNKCVFEKD